MVKTKALMICPFCDDGRAFTWQGVVMHVKATHPQKLQELKDNKAVYLGKFACDELGDPTEPAEPKPEPKPVPEPKEPEPTPAPKTEPEPQAPEVKPPKPAAGGLFPNLRQLIRDL